MFKPISNKGIEAWLKNRLGEGNRFEQFNRQFCKDLCQAQLEADKREILDRAIKTPSGNYYFHIRREEYKQLRENK